MIVNGIIQQKVWDIKMQRGKFWAHQSASGRYIINGPGVVDFVVPADCSVYDMLYTFDKIYYAGRKNKLDEINKALTLVEPNEYR